MFRLQEQFAEADYSFSFESFEKLTDSTDSLVIGSATHLVIQNVDLKNVVNESTICRAINALSEKGYITKRVAEKIDVSSVLKFFDSDLGKLLRGQQKYGDEGMAVYLCSAGS